MRPIHLVVPIVAALLGACSFDPSTYEAARCDSCRGGVRVEGAAVDAASPDAERADAPLEDVAADATEADAADAEVGADAASCTQNERDQACLTACTQGRCGAPTISVCDEEYTCAPCPPGPESDLCLKTYALTRHRIEPASTDELGYFGASVSIFDDWLAVGAPRSAYDRPGEPNLSGERGRGSGRVYLFRREGGAWIEGPWIELSDSDRKRFGASVALAPSELGADAPPRLFVGEPGEEGGRVHVYAIRRFSETEIIKDHRSFEASIEDASWADQFGHSLAVAPPIPDKHPSYTIVVGAPIWQGDGGGGIEIASWTEAGGRTSVKSYSRSGEEEYFGAAVAIAPNAEHVAVTGLGKNPGDGKLFVLRRGGGGWAAEPLTPVESPPDNPRLDDLVDTTRSFGQSVAISERLVAVGAPLTDTEEPRRINNHGALYAREFANTSDALAYPRDEAGTPLANARFGASVALAGETLLVGASTRGRDVSGLGAYFYRWDQGALELIKYDDLGQPRDLLPGVSASTDGRSWALGTVKRDNNSDTPAVFVWAPRAP